MKFLTTIFLFMAMMVGNSSYACDWIRARPIVILPQPQPQVVNYTVVQPQPVVTYQTVWIPVVEQRVQWVWPNYYTVQPVQYVIPAVVRY